MATVLVRMDETVKIRFDSFVTALNDERIENRQSKLTNAQVLEMALDALEAKRIGDLLK